MGRDATHRTCESHHCLDVRELSRSGLLTSTGTIMWSRGDRTTGVATVQGDGDSVTLSYRIDGQEFEERVRLDRTSLHLGGHRSWFLCPGCDRRIAVLYGGVRFRCRHCLDLRYVSQRETPTFRAITKVQIIRKKLGGSGNLIEPCPSRPRYMHQRTYERLIREEAEALRAYASTWGSYS
jgi:hypothetical protein